MRKRCSADDQRRREAEHEELVRRDAQAAEHVARHEPDRDLDLAAVVFGHRAVDELEQVAQHQGGAEARHDERDRVAAPAQPPEQEPVDERAPAPPSRAPPPTSAAISGQPKENGPSGAMGPGTAAMPSERRPGEIGAPGQELAMGEIGEAQDRIDERDADRAERDDGADHEAVGEELQHSGASLATAEIERRDLRIAREVAAPGRRSARALRPGPRPGRRWRARPSRSARPAAMVTPLLAHLDAASRRRRRRASATGRPKARPA